MWMPKYPKNWHANGYGWHNLAALGYDKNPETQSTHSGTSSGYGSQPTGEFPFDLMTITNDSLTKLCISSF